MLDKLMARVYNKGTKNGTRKEMKTMTKIEITEIRNHIANNIGYLPPHEMMKYYHMFMHGSDKYLLGVEFDGMVYGYYTKEIPLKYCSCQTDHKANNQFLRFRPHEWGAQEIATREDAICFGTTEKIYTFYTCNTKKGYNSGYCFEKAVYAKYGREEEWKQDNKHSVDGGDFNLDGEEIQLKYVEKGSLATITSTNKILRQIDKILEIME
jgi:hypothetical protein